MINVYLFRSASYELTTGAGQNPSNINTAFSRLPRKVASAGPIEGDRNIPAESPQHPTPGPPSTGAEPNPGQQADVELDDALSPLLRHPLPVVDVLGNGGEAGGKGGGILVGLVHRGHRGVGKERRVVQDGGVDPVVEDAHLAVRVIDAKGEVPVGGEGTGGEVEGGSGGGGDEDAGEVGAEDEPEDEGDGAEDDEGGDEEEEEAAEEEGGAVGLGMGLVGVGVGRVRGRWWGRVRVRLVRVVRRVGRRRWVPGHRSRRVHRPRRRRVFVVGGGVGHGDGDGGGFFLLFCFIRSEKLKGKRGTRECLNGECEHSGQLPVPP